MQSALDRTFGTPELLEQVFVSLLEDVIPLNDQEDPRSDRTHENARKLKQMLRCSEICRTWYHCLKDSSRMQRGLFLLPDHRLPRTWQHGPQSEQIRLRSYYRAPSLRAPILNPIVQVTFPAYHFRFWHLSLEASGNKHCAYLIVTRRDLPNLKRRAASRQGQTISNMLLSQPPCTALEATIWEERDESKEYVGRTQSLKDPYVKCDGGLTVGMVHERVEAMFDEHLDVAAIKLTTT